MMDEKDKNFLKNLYIESRLEFEKDYFKSILNLSTGALAISISVSQIVFQEKLVQTWSLYFSWILLILAVFLVLAYFVIARHEFEIRVEELNIEHSKLMMTEREVDELRDYTDKKLAGNYLAAFWVLNRKNWISWIYERLSFICSALLLFGFILLAFFTFSNISYSAKYSENNSETSKVIQDSSIVNNDNVIADSTGNKRITLSIDSLDQK